MRIMKEMFVCLCSVVFKGFLNWVRLGFGVFRFKFNNVAAQSYRPVDSPVTLLDGSRNRRQEVTNGGPLDLERNTSSS